MILQKVCFIFCSACFILHSYLNLDKNFFRFQSFGGHSKMSMDVPGSDLLTFIGFHGIFGTSKITLDLLKAYFYLFCWGALPPLLRKRYLWMATRLTKTNDWQKENVCENKKLRCHSAQEAKIGFYSQNSGKKPNRQLSSAFLF